MLLSQARVAPLPWHDHCLKIYQLTCLSKIGFLTMAGERLSATRRQAGDVPRAASFQPWSRTAEGLESAVSGATNGAANVAKGMCRFPAKANTKPNFVNYNT